MKKALPLVRRNNWPHRGGKLIFTTLMAGQSFAFRRITFWLTVCGYGEKFSRSPSPNFPQMSRKAFCSIFLLQVIVPLPFDTFDLRVCGVMATILKKKNRFSVGATELQLYFGKSYRIPYCTTIGTVDSSVTKPRLLHQK